MFELGQNYTRQEIHDQLGGDLQSYLPIANGRAVCACLNRDKNPEAPNVVVVGTGPGIENAGELLAMQVGSIPVFLKQESNAWTFQGSFEVARSTQDPAELAPYKTANGSEITRLIYLKPSGDQVATSAVEPDTRNRHGRSRRRREHLLDGLERSHIVQGIKLFNAGHAHGFADSTKFDLLFEGRHYPPKAVVGLASIPLHGFALVPDDFTGGGWIQML